MEPEFHGASFHMRTLRSPWGDDGPKPESLVRIKPDCFGIGIRMKLPDGGHRIGFYNEERLHEELGDLPPAEYEELNINKTNSRTLAAR